MSDWITKIKQVYRSYKKQCLYKETEKFRVKKQTKHKPKESWYSFTNSK